MSESTRHLLNPSKTTTTSSEDQQQGDRQNQDSWDVEWDVDSPRESSEDDEYEAESSIGSPTAIFRRSYEGPDGKTQVTTAAVLMTLVVVCLVAQTEATVYVQRELKWNKPFFMLYLTHGFYFILWPGLLVFQRWQQPEKPWDRFLDDHLNAVRRTAQFVEHKSLDLSSLQSLKSPIPYMLRTCLIQCGALNLAAITWFIAANMTTPSDLTAINNTSAMFTYIFSVWLLKESMRMTKNIAVVVAILGVFVIAYGNPNDGGSSDPATAGGDSSNRTLGNIICALGAVMFGFYRVLYKLKACLPAEATPEMNIVFSVIVGSSIGVFTTALFWIPLPILHFTGWEVFELPSGAALFWTLVGVVSSAVFTGSFLSLMALTSPVLSSVAAMLSIFVVALYDWLFTGHDLTKATIGGGFLIIVAFLLIGWSTYQETYVENGTGQRELHSMRAHEEV